MCALYFSRSLLESFGGAPFHEDLTRAFDKIENALPPGLWRYIDQLPAVLASKGDRPKKRGTNVPAYVARLTDAVLDHKRVVMRYESFSSQAIKEYRIEPHRLLYGQGGLYLHAFVPIYGEMRTFAVERIKHLSTLDEVFEARADVGADVFPHSMGVLQRPARTRGPRVHGQDGALRSGARVAPHADRRPAARRIRTPHAAGLGRLGAAELDPELRRRRARRRAQAARGTDSRSARGGAPSVRAATGLRRAGRPRVRARVPGAAPPPPREVENAVSRETPP